MARARCWGANELIKSIRDTCVGSIPLSLIADVSDIGCPNGLRIENAQSGTDAGIVPYHFASGEPPHVSPPIIKLVQTLTTHSDDETESHCGIRSRTFPVTAQRLHCGLPQGEAPYPICLLTPARQLSNRYDGWRHARYDNTEHSMYAFGSSLLRPTMTPATSGSSNHRGRRAQRRTRTQKGLPKPTKAAWRIMRPSDRPRSRRGRYRTGAMYGQLGVLQLGRGGSCFPEEAFSAGDGKGNGRRRRSLRSLAAERCRGDSPVIRGGQGAAKTRRGSAGVDHNALGCLVVPGLAASIPEGPEAVDDEGQEERP